MGKTFRLFVSSTFSDFKAERTVLQEKVFPHVRSLCLQNGWDFIPIDLRWGVTDEAALDQQTMRICLEEVYRCAKTGLKPNFMLLLGNRYGWRPLPFQIEKGEFERLREFISEPGDRTLLDRWYRCDENQIPPAYSLQPRLGPLAEFADWRLWDTVETRLRTCFSQAIDQGHMTGDSRLRYEASATEQEIVAGIFNVPDAGDHVLAFSRSISGLPDDLQAKDFCDFDAAGAIDVSARERLVCMRQRVEQILPNTLFRYETRWEGDSIALDHLEAFRADAESQLSRLILSEIRRHEETPAILREAVTHCRFAETSAAELVGRTEIISDVQAFLATEQGGVFVLSGPSGIGKSAIIAGAAAMAAREWPKATVVTRFIGITPSSSNVRSLLEGIIAEIESRRECTSTGGFTRITPFTDEALRENFSVQENTPPQEKKPSPKNSSPPQFISMRDLSGAFENTLTTKPGEPPILVFLDALDQLSKTDQGMRLYWLPTRLPDRVKIVVSTLNPSECLPILERRFTPESIRFVSPLPCVDGERLVMNCLSREHRCLTVTQRQLVLDRVVSGGNPLLLRLCAEEVRQWPSFNTNPTLAGDINGVMKQLFLRLEVRHGAAFIARTLASLAAARNGISEQELPDVLAADQQFLDQYRSSAHHELPRTGNRLRLPGVIISRLLADLRPYLIEKSVDEASLLNFFHREFAEVVAATFLPDASKPRAHAVLMDYFAELPLRFSNALSGRPNLRKLSELAYQQVLAGRWMEAQVLLSDLDYIRCKCETESATDLIADYQRYLESAPEKHHTTQIEDFSRFVQSQMHVLKRFPALTTQQALNQPPASAPAKVAHGFDTEKQDAPPTFLWLNRPLFHDPATLTLTDPTRGTRNCAWSHDGQTLLSTSSDSAARLWDAATGAEILTISTELGILRTALFSGNDRVVFLAGESGHVGFFDFASGAELRRLHAHDLTLRVCRLSPDGKTLLTAGDDGYLKLWASESGDLVRSISVTAGESDPSATFIGRIFSAAWSGDGRHIAVGSEDRRIRIYDAHTFLLTSMFETPGGWCRCLSFHPDGERFAAGGTDGNVTFRSLKSTSIICTFSGHTDWIRDCAISPDGRHLLTAGSDRQLILWDITSGSQLQRFSGHTDRVMSCSFSPDGRRFVSASVDSTIRLFAMKSFGSSETRATTAHDSDDADDGNDSNNAYSAGNRHFAPVQTCRFLRGEPRFVSVAGDSSMMVWDAISGRRLLTESGCADHITVCEAFPTGDRLIIAGDDRAIRIWDIAARKEIMKCTGHRAAVTACTIFPGRSRFVSASLDCTLKIWDLETGGEIATLSGHTAAIRGVAVSPDESCILSFSDDSTLRVWDSASGAERAVLTGHTGEICCAGFSPDARLMHSAARDNIVRIWDAVALRSRFTLSGHSGGISSVQWAPDQSSILSASGDGMLRFWDPADGRLIRGITAHESPITEAVISPDGRHVASASLDGLLRLWQPTSDVPSATWVGSGALRGLVFSGNGSRLAVSEDSGILYILQCLHLPAGSPIITRRRAPDRWLGLKKGVCAFECPMCAAWTQVISDTASCKACCQPFVVNPWSVEFDPMQFLQEKS
ncbi:MAG: AAA family ATPase [Candidatus Ozemobacteraceae bacterium]